MKTILHVSDLHFGKTNDAVILRLLDAIIQGRPDMVVISGDLTQRAHIPQYESARAFLDSIYSAGISTFVIPGNHDIRPLFAPLKRALSPYDRYREHISEEIEPRHVDEHMAIAAVNTVRPEQISNGRVVIKKVKDVRDWFGSLEPDKIRILVTHHPLDLPLEWGRRPARRAKKAVYTLEPGRVDMYLSGHYHRSSVVSMSIRYDRLTTPALSIQAGTVSERGRGEAHSFNIITLDERRITVDTHLLSETEGKFASTGGRTFVQEHGIWRPL